MRFPKCTLTVLSKSIHAFIIYCCFLRLNSKNAQNVIHLSPLHSLADVIALPAKERQRTSRPTLCYCQKMSLGIICLILWRPLARFRDLEVTSPFSAVQLRKWEDYCVSREEIRGQICECIERQFSNKYSYLIQDSVVSVIKVLAILSRPRHNVNIVFVFMHDSD